MENDKLNELVEIVANRLACMADAGRPDSELIAYVYRLNGRIGVALIDVLSGRENGRDGG